MNKSKLQRELGRAIANSHFEFTDSGVAFPESGLRMGGVFDIAVNDEAPEYFHNTMSLEFLNSAFQQLFRGASILGSYYLAPFAGNVTPTVDWTASGFASTATEFTNYDEATRQAWTVADAVTDGGADEVSITNAASKAQFTIASGGQTTIWGAAVLSASAKSSTAGVLVAAAKAASARTGLVDGDLISIGYTLKLSDNTA